MLTYLDKMLFQYARAAEGVLIPTRFYSSSLGIVREKLNDVADS